MSRISKLIQTLALDASEISSRSGIPMNRVQAIAQGDAATLEELRALARGLRLPIRAFMGEVTETDNLSVLFRQKAGSRPDLGVEAVFDFVSAALSILPPRKTLADWIRACQGPADTYLDAVALAERFRQDHFDGAPDPITSLPKLLDDLGGVILGRLDTSRFEGASLVVDGYAFLFISPRFSGRMLFTLAHELGHLFAHHRDSRSAVFDLASQIGNVRHASKNEAFADAFASNLLMPSDGVAIALREIRTSLDSKADAIGDIEILYLALFYGVSFEVAARRCEQLELLPPGGAYSLSDHLKKVHGSAEKLAQKLALPARAPIDIPRISSNLLRATINKIERGDVSIGWATDRFGCSASDIYAAKSVRERTYGNRH